MHSAPIITHRVAAATSLQVELAVASQVFVPVTSPAEFGILRQTAVNVPLQGPVRTTSRTVPGTVPQTTLRLTA